MALERLRVAEDPWYAIEKGYVYTEDEKRGGLVAPMPALPYLKILTRLWQLFPIGMLLKSRQLMASWLWCWLQLHQALYQRGSLAILQGKRHEDVKAVGTKSLMGRVLFMFENLPFFLRPEKVEVQTQKEDLTRIQGRSRQTLTTLVVPMGGVMIAAPQGPNIIRSRTASSVQMDELPHMPDGKAGWTAAMPTVIGAPPLELPERLPWMDDWDRFVTERGCPDLKADHKKWPGTRMWGVGTPNGPEWVWNKVGVDGWHEWKELTGFKHTDGDPVEGLRYILKPLEYEGFKLKPMLCIRLHYTAELNLQAWAIRRASRAAYDDEADYERENEISCRIAAGSPVFSRKEFGQRHLLRWTPNPRRPTSISFDTGYQGQSVAFWQHSMVHVGQGKYWLRCHCFAHFLHKGVSLDDVLEEVKELMYSWNLDWQNAHYYTDYNTLNTRHGGLGLGDLEIFRAHRIEPRARKVGPFQKSQTINLVRRLLKTWSDGKPGLTVDPDRAPLVVQMFDGGWRYKEPKAGVGPIEEPLKDGTYDHVGDCVSYLIWNIHRTIWSADPNIEPDLPSREEVDWVRERAILQHRNRREPPGDTMGPARLIRED